MARLPLSKQLTFAAIVGGVAFVTSMLLAMLPTSPTTIEHATLSSFIGLIFGATAGVFYLLLSGNRKMPIADDAARTRALAGPEDGMGQVLVVREGFAGKLAGVDILVDGTAATQLKSPRFASLSLTPGCHDVVASVQGKSTAPLNIDLAARETILLRVVIGIGKAKLTREMDISTGRLALKTIPMVSSKGVS